VENSINSPSVVIGGLSNNNGWAENNNGGPGNSICGPPVINGGPFNDNEGSENCHGLIGNNMHGPTPGIAPVIYCIRVAADNIRGPTS